MVGRRFTASGACHKVRADGLLVGWSVGRTRSLFPVLAGQRPTASPPHPRGPSVAQPLGGRGQKFYGWFRPVRPGLSIVNTKRFIREKSTDEKTNSDRHRTGPATSV